MEIIMLFSVLLSTCFLPTSMKSDITPSEKIEKIVGIYWFPLSEKGVANPRKGFMFTSKNSLSGHDGCNAFWGELAYLPEKGFKVKSLIRTELMCRNNESLFSVSFLSQAYSFEVKGREIIFFDKNKQEITRLFTFAEVNETSNALLKGDWKTVESNAPDFQAVKEAGREPYLRFLKDGRFVVNYNKDKNEWTSVNYFSGYCNMNKENKNIYFYINAEAGALVMPNGEDAQVAQHFKKAQYWEMKGKQLIIKSGEYYFVLESF